MSKKPDISVRADTYERLKREAKRRGMTLCKFVDELSARALAAETEVARLNENQVGQLEIELQTATEECLRRLARMNALCDERDQLKRDLAEALEMAEISDDDVQLMPVDKFVARIAELRKRAGL